MMQLLCYSSQTKESPEATQNASAAVGKVASRTRRYLPLDESRSKQKSCEFLNHHFSATMRTLESQQKHRDRLKMSPQRTPCLSESSFSLNPESPRLLQSQQKHCARMLRTRSKQSPDIERRQKQKLLLQRMMVTPLIARHSEKLHSPNQLQNSMPEKESLPGSPLQQTPPRRHQFLDEILIERNNESFQLLQHSKRQSQIVEKQQQLQRGSVTLRQVVQSGSNSQVPADFERIFSILEAMNVDHPVFDVVISCVDT
jgi:hypothetical protein